MPQLCCSETRETLHPLGISSITPEHLLNGYENLSNGINSHVTIAEIHKENQPFQKQISEICQSTNPIIHLYPRVYPNTVSYVIYLIPRIYLVSVCILTLNPDNIVNL